MHGLLTVRPANAFVREVVRGRQAPVATQVHPIHEMQRLFSVRRRFAAIAQPAASVALAATALAAAALAAADSAAQPAASVALAALYGARRVAPVAPAAEVAAVALALAAVASAAAAELHYGSEWCPLSRRRVHHRQRPRVPGVDEPSTTHARKHADRQTEQRIR